MIKLIELEIT